MDTDTMPKRVNLTLSDVYYSDLQKWAEHRGEPVATFATYLLRVAIDEARRSGEIPDSNKTSSPKEE
jgi:hypothetical protein